MCRYSIKAYKMRYACLECRLSFKEPYIKDHLHASSIGTWGKECPTCKTPMQEMGRDFKPPKKSDKKAWKSLQESGQTFHSCEC